MNPSPLFFPLRKADNNKIGKTEFPTRLPFINHSLGSFSFPSK
ncbi:Uncharacterized protein APZ42_020338 [Daphnia magna]|uniref:Uncharacterized protein n=1 Tax=Daphnia magna TaxID=35525 RepID=A0A164XLF7_9CRUS|nr:Uncharacterized protein APZ42_020338 [Daphnia magna]